MDIIFYWKKKYFSDEYYNRGFEFYSKYPPTKILSQGDIMWVITKTNGLYVLVGKFFIKRTTNKPSSKHGSFCIISDTKRSIYYKLDSKNQMSFFSFLKNLFIWTNSEIGVYFHGERHIRQLSKNEHQEIDNFSKNL